MGSLTRTVLTGEASLRTAASGPWHGHGPTTALQKAIDEQNRMTRTSVPPSGCAQAALATMLRLRAIGEGAHPLAPGLPVYLLLSPVPVRHRPRGLGLLVRVGPRRTPHYRVPRRHVPRESRFSISIGTDRKIEDVPRLRMCTIVVFFVDLDDEDPEWRPSASRAVRPK
jgi:hypothetical protein